MDKLSEQEVIELSRHIAKNELRDTIQMMKSEYTADSIMDFIESWARVAGYPYRHHVDESGKFKKKHSFTFEHAMGERWSLYFVELFKFAFEQIGIKIDFQHTTNTISFQLEF